MKTETGIQKIVNILRCENISPKTYTQVDAKVSIYASDPEALRLFEILEEHEETILDLLKTGPLYVLEQEYTKALEKAFQDNEDIEDAIDENLMFYLAHYPRLERYLLKLHFTLLKLEKEAIDAIRWQKK